MKVDQSSTPLSQTSQLPPADFQKSPESSLPPKPKKWLKTVLVILAILISLSIGGFFILKNTSIPEINLFKIKKTEEEVYIYKGIWTPTLLIQDQNYLSSKAQKLKDLGINTVFIMAPPPQYEEWLEKARKAFQTSPELIELLEEILPIHKEIIINNIQDAHENGLRVGLTLVSWNPLLEMEIDKELLNAKIIEYARLAEEYDVELFAPMGEPEKVFGKETAKWGQEILPRIKEVYHGQITSKGIGIGLPARELTNEFFRELAEQPPGQFAGYDYIGFSPMISPEIQTLEEYSEYVENALKYTLAQAERDGCKGVIITEFGVLDGHFLSKEESARAHEIVLEKGKDKVVGFFANSDFLGGDISGIPGWPIEENLKTEAVLREWFIEILPEKKIVVY
jgi:hypothetical protein